MKIHFLFAVLSALIVGATGASPVSADDGCQMGEAIGCGCSAPMTCGECDCTCCPTDPDSFCHYLPQIGRWRVYGWLDGGFVGNTSGPASKFNGPYNAVDRSNEAMFNQGYLVTERLLPDCGWGVGGRVDLLYGEDFWLAQSTGWELNPDGTPRWNGNEYYGLAMPQMYAEVGSQDFSVKLGHFYSTVGYEGVMSPYNFFYSKSYSYQFAGPFTHWGGLATWKLNDCWQVHAGLHNGWNQLDRVHDNLGLIAGIKYTDCCSGWWTSFAITTGKENNNLAGLLPPAAMVSANRTRYSWLVSLPLTCRLNYVFHHWLGLQEEGAVGGATAFWYGIDQYLYYTLNDCWKAGFRFEWFRDDDGTRIGLNRPSNPNNPPFVGNAFSLTCGLNWSPTTNLMVRPELRWDWFDGAGLPYADGTQASQLLLGVDAIWRF